LHLAPVLLGDSGMSNDHLSQPENELKLPGAQVVIQRSFLSLFGGRGEAVGVDWDWAEQLLQLSMLPQIQKRLKNTLYGGLLSELDLSKRLELIVQLQSQSTAIEAAKMLSSDMVQQEQIDPHQPIIQTYARDDIAGKLLIVGTPGAGKTTTLLTLAEQLVGEAIAHPKTIIPIIFELSEWRDNKQSIQEWLVEQLYESFGGNQEYKVYEIWLEQQVLLPLLDGLDELDPSQQQLVSQKINEFAHLYPHLLVCAQQWKWGEYKTGISYGNLKGVIQLLPLSNEKIKDYLKQVGKSGLWQQIEDMPEMRKLLDPLENDEVLETDSPSGLLRLPLFIKLAAEIYEPDKPFSGKRELLSRYIERQLQLGTRKNDRNHPSHNQYKWSFRRATSEPNPRRSVYILSWISGVLKQEKQAEFLIESIQPKHLRKSRKLKVIRIFLGISFLVCPFGTIIVAVKYLPHIVVYPFISFIFQASMNYLLAGIAITGCELIGTNEFKKVESVNNPRFFKFSRIKRRINENFYLWLFIGFIWGAFYVLTDVFASGRWPVLEGVFSWLSASFIFGFVFETAAELKQGIKTCFSPNEGIANSFKLLVLMVPISIFIVLLVPSTEMARLYRNTLSDWSWLDQQSLSGNIFWERVRIDIVSNISSLIKKKIEWAFIAGAWLGFMSSGTAFLGHFALRICLTFNQNIPWNLAQFLNYCTERRLLQRVGGRYRFIHWELLNYFADTTSAEVAINPTLERVDDREDI
jgi:DNA polymerase III delta prime subunit